MLPADLLSALQAYALNRDPLPSGASPAPSAPSPSLASTLQLGQQVQGTVLAEISSGLYTVRVNTQVIQLPLPMSLPAGAGITLQVLTLQPRLTFGVVNASSTPEAGTTAQLGTTARMLSDLMQAPQQSQVQGSLSRVPLAASSGTLDPVALAQSLQQALTASGLFYESHQGQWVSGQQSTAQLRAEPQNQPQAVLLSGHSGPMSGNGVAGAVPSSELAAGTPALRQALVRPLPGNGGTVSGTDTAGAILSSAVTPGVPAHLQALVQQQLGILESGRVLWQGMLTPQQALKWQIWPESSSRSAQDQTTSTWHTEVHLGLPVLGAVTAHLTLDSRGVKVRLGTLSASTRATLTQHGPDLVASLQARGLEVTNLSVVTSVPPTEGEG
ncbi:flagellar hook-length control protein FliK [Ferrovum sp.]|uniref:flagellar hook-length control protein FliK n=1 Tax=Ferrovum sp. TaxID=2609467 RepID=UPI0026326782|nr:flagellar hook-length control protein FliK [Ferrovum sp.]